MDGWSALALTLACELPLALLLARGLPAQRVLFVAASASALTHPLAWRAALLLMPGSYRAGVALIELAVVIAEALWLRAWLSLSLARAAVLSLVVNAASALAGWWLWPA